MNVCVLLDVLWIFFPFANHLIHFDAIFSWAEMFNCNKSHVFLSQIALLMAQLQNHDQIKDSLIFYILFCSLETNLNIFSYINLVVLVPSFQNLVFCPLSWLQYSFFPKTKLLCWCQSDSRLFVSWAICYFAVQHSLQGHC